MGPPEHRKYLEKAPHIRGRLLGWEDWGWGQILYPDACLFCDPRSGKSFVELTLCGNRRNAARGRASMESSRRDTEDRAWLREKLAARNSVSRSYVAAITAVSSGGSIRWGGGIGLLKGEETSLVRWTNANQLYCSGDGSTSRRSFGVFSARQRYYTVHEYSSSNISLSLIGDYLSQLNAHIKKSTESVSRTDKKCILEFHGNAPSLYFDAGNLDSNGNISGRLTYLATQTIKPDYRRYPQRLYESGSEPTYTFTVDGNSSTRQIPGIYSSFAENPISSYQDDFQPSVEGYPITPSYDSYKAELEARFNFVKSGNSGIVTPWIIPQTQYDALAAQRIGT